MISSIPDQDDIVAVPPIQRIVARAPIQRVVAAAAVDGVGAFEPMRLLAPALPVTVTDPPQPRGIQILEIVLHQGISTERDLVAHPPPN